MAKGRWSLNRVLRVEWPIALLFFLISVALPFPAIAQDRPLLHPLFSDHAVLQRGQAVPLWGWVGPGTKVTVTFGDQTVHTTAGPDGKWTCTLAPLKVSSAGRVLKITADGGATVEARNVLVGDVWLCSGQSNMEMGITQCNEDEEIAAANFPGIRLLTVSKKTAFEPQEMVSTEWLMCSPEALREGGAWGGFSATAYFFGKKLHQELGIPIGLIHSSWGGTQAEAWTSAPALADYPSFQAKLREIAAIAQSTAADPEQDYLENWFKTHDPGTQEEWHLPRIDTSGWRDVTLPGRWADCGIGGFEGVVWARRELDLPSGWLGEDLVMELGEISDNDTTWLNGREIGATIGFGKPRTYQVPAGSFQAEGNVIAVRVVNAGGGAIQAEKHPLRIFPANRPEESVSLAGSWRLQETARKQDTGRPLIGNPRVPVSVPSER